MLDEVWQIVVAQKKLQIAVAQKKCHIVVAQKTQQKQLHRNMSRFFTL